MNDEQLMLEFQKGSTKAFEELFTRYRTQVYGFFRRRLNHAARAEELAQETFVIIIRGAGEYEPRAKFRTYMFSVALKQLWSERRKDMREARANAEPFQEGRETDPAAGLWVKDALARMDADHREVLMLREYEQLSYEDIAEVLAVPINTVRSRLSRARAELRTLLDERNECQPDRAQPSRDERSECQPDRAQPSRDDRSECQPDRPQPSRDDRSECQPDRPQPSRDDRNECQPDRPQPSRDDRSERQPDRSQPSRDDRSERQPDSAQPLGSEQSVKGVSR